MICRWCFKEITRGGRSVSRELYSWDCISNSGHEFLDPLVQMVYEANDDSQTADSS